MKESDAWDTILPVPESGASCLALGQTGFVFRTSSGTTVAIDPYLTDWAETGWGVKRVIEPPIDPSKFKPDLLLISHWHEDHLDAPLIKQWATQDSHCVFAGPISCTARANAWGWPAGDIVELSPGSEISLRDCRVTATHARHEEEIAPAPDAIGFVIETEGMRIWHAGDTEYDVRLRSLANLDLDVAIIPINGGANMTTDEAAFLAWKIGARVVVPSHYDMWGPEGFGPDVTLDPTAFASQAEAFGCESDVRILVAGQTTNFTTTAKD